jgi:hypothetical protein
MESETAMALQELPMDPEKGMPMAPEKPMVLVTLTVQEMAMPKVPVMAKVQGSRSHPVSELGSGVSHRSVGK